MVDFDSWLSGSTVGTPSAAARAGSAWQRIQDKPTIIQLKRSGATIAAQTVRVEYSSSTSMQTGQVSTKGVIEVTLFGVQGHTMVADTDIRTGDRFVLDNTEFEVSHIVHRTGEVQAHAEGKR